VNPVTEVSAMRINENLVIPCRYLEEPGGDLWYQSGCGYFADLAEIGDEDVAYEKACVNCDGSQCKHFDGISFEHSNNMDPLVMCSHYCSVGYACKRQANQPDIQQLTYRIFDLIEPAIKAAIAQALSEHLESSE
jgi:hypothetical protein